MTSLSRILLLLALPFALATCGDDAARQPNVLFIVIDTLRADHLSTYGYEWETSPRIDALAERGAVFLDCTAQSSWTMPSMISLMTGHPIFHSIWRIPDKMPMLSEQFEQAGYRTGGFAANQLLHADAGFARGLQSWEIQSEGPKWTADDVARRADAFLDQRRDENAEQPFFLWLHFLDPHKPYSPPERPWTRDVKTVFDEAEQRTIERTLDGLPPEERLRLAGQREQLAHDIDGYDGEIAFTDRRIGDLLDRLERDDELEQTLVVIVSDHGEGLYGRPEHPKKLAEVRQYNEKQGQPMHLSEYLQGEHGYWMSEALVRTPFIIAGPGVAPGQRIEALVSNIDVAPTVLELAGLPPMNRVRGRSLASPLRSAGSVPSSEFAVSACYENAAVKTPDGRKVVRPLDDMQYQYGHRPELFDLKQDPGERRPLPLDDEARQLLEYLKQSRENDIFREFSRNQQLDPETEERLRQMGYIR